MGLNRAWGDKLLCTNIARLYLVKQGWSRFKQDLYTILIRLLNCSKYGLSNQANSIVWIVYNTSGQPCVLCEIGLNDIRYVRLPHDNAPADKTTIVEDLNKSIGNSFTTPNLLVFTSCQNLNVWCGWFNDSNRYKYTFRQQCISFECHTIISENIVNGTSMHANRWKGDEILCLKSLHIHANYGLPNDSAQELAYFSKGGGVYNYTCVIHPALCLVVG